MTKLTNKSELLNALTDRLKEIYDISQDEIDDLSVAIISDFVSTLEPVGYLSRESEYRLTHYGGNDSKGTVPIHSTNKKGKHTPLFDLSEWINK